MSSILDMLKTAAMPLGKTMYIYGGGWNEADDGAGRECLTMGLSPKWSAFANSCGADYNFRSYDYKRDKSVIHLGLDCSGYVGWVLFNTLKNGSGQGYVFKSTEVVKRLSEMGLGRRIPRSEVKIHRAGDIMSSACGCCAHVYICVGECEDKSLVLLHSSPCGVQLSGTYTPKGDKNSMAAAAAESYMKRYYPKWMDRFPDCLRDEKYLTHYEQLENTFCSDNENVRNMTAEMVLELIFNE